MPKSDKICGKTDKNFVRTDRLIVWIVGTIARRLATNASSSITTSGGIGCRAITGCITATITGTDTIQIRTDRIVTALVIAATWITIRELITTNPAGNIAETTHPCVALCVVRV